MIEALKKIEKKYQDLSTKLSNGEVDYNSNEYKHVAREHRSLEETVEKYNTFKSVRKQIDETKEMIASETDPELKTMAEEELEDLEAKHNELENELRLSLIPKSPHLGKNIIVEIRAGTGGEEAGLFAGDLFRMYTKYAEKNGWKVDILNTHDTGVGGYKEVIVSIAGDDAFEKLQFESGGHRVQRIPVTESGGRIHTSAVTVAVLPEAEESEIDINPNELRIDVYRSSGPGGQSVNTTDSAVRITHVPTNTVVTCQDEKSQLKNKNKALRVLRTRLQEIQEKEQKKEIDEERKSQVGSGDRSERIRTYNFPQNRITDHRINFSIYNKMTEFLNGEIDEMVDTLIKQNKEELLKQLGT